MSRTGDLQRVVALAIFLTLILGSPLLSWAHTPPRLPVTFAQLPQHGSGPSELWAPAAPSVSPATPGALLTLAVVVLIAMALARRRWPSRSTIAVTLMLCLAMFTYGTAVHSVHHLADPEKAAQCSVSLASQHISGTLTHTCHASAPVLTATAVPLSHCNVPTSSPRFPSDLSRAPPGLLS
jgi:ABC-type Fe3+ transport system permease subunit